MFGYPEIWILKSSIAKYGNKFGFEILKRHFSCKNLELYWWQNLNFLPFRDQGVLRSLLGLCGFFGSSGIFLFKPQLNMQSAISTVVFFHLLVIIFFFFYTFHTKYTNYFWSTAKNSGHNFHTWWLSVHLSVYCPNTRKRILRTFKLHNSKQTSLYNSLICYDLFSRKMMLRRGSLNGSCLVSISNSKFE